VTERRLLAGLDIGGSKVLAVAVAAPIGDERPDVVAQVRLTTFQGPEGVVDTAHRALIALAGQLPGHGGWHGGPQDVFSGVGIGVPGLVDPARGMVTHAVNLGIGMGGLPLADRLRRRTGLPVVIENDVNAATCGVAQHLRLGPIDLAYLSIGTGLAAGIMLSGELRRGPHNAAGEIGHVPIDLSGPICNCGQRGCLEVLASGSAIAARWPPRPPSGPAPSDTPVSSGNFGTPDIAKSRDGLHSSDGFGVAGEPTAADERDSPDASDGTESQRLFSGLEQIADPGTDSKPTASDDLSRAPAQALFAAAGAGDPRAIAVRDDIAAHLAAAVRMIVLTTDVDLVVLGGGVAEVGEPLQRAVAAALRQQAEGSPFLRGLDLPARLMLAPTDEPVAAIGAALLARPPFAFLTRASG
jgi:predicted NBD/HSP70 family sugar kinase